MKIRTGYVSNSSSSSFVVIGKKINNPEEALRQGKNVMVYVPAGGSSGEAEDWSMFLTEEALQMLYNSKWFKSMEHTFIEVYDKDEFEYDYREDIIKVKKPVKGTLFAFLRDYSSPNSIEGLKDFLEQEDSWR